MKISTAIAPDPLDFFVRRGALRLPPELLHVRLAGPRAGRRRRDGPRLVLVRGNRALVLLLRGERRPDAGDHVAGGSAG